MDLWHDESTLRVLGVFVAGALMISGCSYQTYDPDTGTHHLWGIGHLSVRATPANEGVRAVVRGYETFGLSIGRLEQRTFFMLGYDSGVQTNVTDDTVVRIEMPRHNLFDVRVGTTWPASPPIIKEPSTGGRS